DRSVCADSRIANQLDVSLEFSAFFDASGKCTGSYRSTLGHCGHAAFDRTSDLVGYAPDFFRTVSKTFKLCLGTVQTNQTLPSRCGGHACGGGCDAHDGECDILCQCATHITRGVIDSLQSVADTLKGISHFGKFALFLIQIIQSVFGVVKAIVPTIHFIDLILV